MLKTSLPLGLSQPHSSHSLRSGQAPYRQQTPPTFTHSRRLGRHQGFTLLEVLIATAVTMLMMLGLAQIFRVLGESMSQGRAGLELNNRLRSVMHRIRTDLDNVTVTPRPPIAVGTAQGYLKYYEGPASDFSIARVDTDGSLLPAGRFNDVLTRFGDIDDIFMATVKAKDTWFTGKVPRFVAERRAPASASELFAYVTISSQFAEVVIFAQPTVRQGSNGMRDPAVLALNDLTDLAFDPNTLAVGIPNSYRLHYRTLLIRPDLNLESGRLGALATDNVMVAQSQDIQVPSNLDPNLVPAISELGLNDVQLS
ncbi:MAG TPA: hypothetical protein DCF63_00700, partial [Planctomycetaceae bacterium]|nr:hypothetical protein [Planctomycetaceae bacterium]